MTQKNEPAFPNSESKGPDGKYCWLALGLTAIEHAAIHTGQPCSGTPWLDEMIRAQRRERLAGQALASINFDDAPRGKVAQWACEIADALISALEGGAK